MAALFAPTRTITPSSAAPPAAVPLPYVHIIRDLDNWCWAAVAAGVDQFYTPAGTAVRSQCQLVTDTLIADGQLAAGSTCCPPAVGGTGDRDYLLDSALQEVGRLVAGPSKVDNPWALSPALGQTPAALIAAEIGLGRVVGVRISHGVAPGPPPVPLGHFLVVYGHRFSGTVEYIDISDPDPLVGVQTQIPLARLWTGYNCGTWSHVYTTG